MILAFAMHECDESDNVVRPARYEWFAHFPCAFAFRLEGISKIARGAADGLSTRRDIKR